MEIAKSGQNVVTNYVTAGNIAKVTEQHDHNVEYLEDITDSIDVFI